jgi:hypothetical protein
MRLELPAPSEFKKKSRTASESPNRQRVPPPSILLGSLAFAPPPPLQAIGLEPLFDDVVPEGEIVVFLLLGICQRMKGAFLSVGYAKKKPPIVGPVAYGRALPCCVVLPGRGVFLGG